MAPIRYDLVKKREILDYLECNPDLKRQMTENKRSYIYSHCDGGVIVVNSHLFFTEDFKDEEIKLKLENIIKQEIK